MVPAAMQPSTLEHLHSCENSNDDDVHFNVKKKNLTHSVKILRFYFHSYFTWYHK